MAGSKEAQEAFNPVKSSICAGTDYDKSLFGKYRQSAMDDWASDRAVGSYTTVWLLTIAWNVQMAGSLLAALPSLLIYIFPGRYFLRGLLAPSRDRTGWGGLVTRHGFDIQNSHATHVTYLAF